MQVAQPPIGNPAMSLHMPTMASCVAAAGLSLGSDVATRQACAAEGDGSAEATLRCGAGWSERELRGEKWGRPKRVASMPKV